MPYTTPELLCVGSAQKLVLGDVSFDAPSCNLDLMGTRSLETELW